MIKISTIYKCEYLPSELNYSEHVIRDKKLKPNFLKIKAVKNHEALHIIYNSNRKTALYIKKSFRNDNGT